MYALTFLGACCTIKGDKRTPSISNRSYTLWCTNSGYIHFSLSPAGQPSIELNSPSGWIQLNRWYHVAGAVDGERGVMRLFINGVEVLHQSVARGIYRSSLPLRIGSSHEEERSEHGTFAGQIDEVRVWQIARTEAEIRATMYTSLSGKEPGLVGCWNFEGQGEKAIDVTGNGHDGQFIGNAKRIVGELPPVFLSGIITNEKGETVPHATVRLEYQNPLSQGATAILQTDTNSSGRYSIATFPEGGTYDLSAEFEGRVASKPGLNLSEGGRREVSLTIELPPHHAVIRGVVSNESGNRIANADIHLEQGGKRMHQTVSDASGDYELGVYPVHEPSDLSATAGERGDWKLGLRFREGEQRRVDLRLKEAISISGALFHPGVTLPHVSTQVQAVVPTPDGKAEPVIIATVLSDKNGEYQFINLKPGAYQVRCYTTNGFVY
ncbi:carboxypeptidase regulatory-like domain-containing protein [Candidatus Poribacteria bacterium]|nr:carboxypeptidase regulatory-like domain-containing protein [Candidatus Poribacteria bacterium]